jgi:hypothetical protein
MVEELPNETYKDGGCKVALPESAKRLKAVAIKNYMVEHGFADDLRTALRDVLTDIMYLAEDCDVSFEKLVTGATEVLNEEKVVMSHG